MSEANSGLEQSGGLSALQPYGNCIYHQSNIQKFHVLSTQYIYVFFTDLRTNSDYSPILHYNRDGRVNCAVRAESLNALQIFVLRGLRCKSRTMTFRAKEDKGKIPRGFEDR